MRCTRAKEKQNEDGGITVNNVQDYTSSGQREREIERERERERDRER